MPKGPIGEKRPADVIGNAMRVKEIAEGESEEESEDENGKGKAAEELGRNDGWARAEKLTPEQHVEIARKAAGIKLGKSSCAC